MRREFIITAIICLIAICSMQLQGEVRPADKSMLSRGLARTFAELHPGETAPVWVFFSDRGLSEAEISDGVERASRILPDRTIRRRAKVNLSGADELDLPVKGEYIAYVETTGARLRVATRWFNGVSVDATLEQVEIISAAEFVRAVKPVGRGRRIDVSDYGFDSFIPVRSDNTDYNYGPSLPQLAQINVVELHDRGITGAGALVCLLDTGCRTSHIAFQGMNIVATWDFINGDSIVYNEPGDPEHQHDHGTYTLSACGSAVEGQLYGPAFGASFLMGKTEATNYELPIEEDFYVAGLEWADSLGADVVSTSLGYIDWYTWPDLNGDSCVTTIGVDIAVSRGIVCVTAAGNERTSNWGHIIAPADADSVISVGAVEIDSTIAGFSSPGPSYDGRIKPEVCALGVGTRCADPRDNTRFRNANGTSLSTPLVGGVVALLLEAHPRWTPMKVREALMMTASQARYPDNDFGWGIVNAFDAAKRSYYPIWDSSIPPQDSLTVDIDSTITFSGAASDLDGDPLSYRLEVGDSVYASRDTGFFQVTFSHPCVQTVRMIVEDVIGYADTVSWVVTVENLSSAAERGVEVPGEFSLKAYPNPFNQHSLVSYTVERPGYVRLSVYDITGREVAVLAEGFYPAGRHEVGFDGTGLASGVYLARLEAGELYDTAKLLLLK